MKPRVLPLLFVACLGGGCLSMNTFETARTLEAGDMSHTISLTSYAPVEGTKAPVPLPKYAFHLGVADGLEIGAQAGLPGQLRLLAKYNPLRTKYLDAAVSPGAWVSFLPHSSQRGESHPLVVGADIPLVLDINLARWLTVVPWAGPGYVYSPEAEVGGAIVRAGLGLQFRVSRGVRIHPEASTIIDPVRGEPIDYAFGVAVSLGDIPRFL